MNATLTLEDDAATDAWLVQRAAAQDGDAVKLLYQRHSSLLYSVLVEMLADHEEAQDVLHDVFRGLLEKPKPYDPSYGRPVGWLITMARHRALDRARRRKSHQRYVDFTTRQPEVNTVTEATVFNDESEHLQECVDTLPTEQRKILHLAYFGGLTHQEIAEGSEHPLGTVKAWIRRGLVKLRDCLEGRGL
jgi:RNA polymerase sigma factor (sigma-70 family)